jgi:hypothetical protein
LLQAPFLHIHPEPIEHPAAHVLHVHSHLEDPVTGPVIGVHTADENEIDLAWHVLTRPLLDFAVDLPVARLVRVRIGPISLGRLKAGAVRDLTADEVLSLAKLVAKAKRRVRRDEASSL